MAVHGAGSLLYVVIQLPHPMRNVERLPAPLRALLKIIVPDTLHSTLHDWDYHLGQIIDTIQHHIEFSPSPRPAKARRVIRTGKHLIGRPRILCYPDLPGPGSVLYKLSLHAGYALTNEPSGSYDAAVKWRNATYTPNDETLTALAASTHMLNANLTDISKGHVSREFREVFGYDLSVDPHTFTGPILRKSEENAAHDGRVLNGPIHRTKSDQYVYQRLVNNVKGDLAIDLRVPIFGSQIPFVRVKYRPVNKRFDHAGRSQVDDEVKSPNEVLCQREQELILKLCRRMGLDYGELDVLRDQETERIYVVDVNGTPTGPTFVSATLETKTWCFDKMANALHNCLFAQNVTGPTLPENRTTERSPFSHS